MEKENYFPRKKFFEESQDLIATFYSTGNYISENSSEYSTMLSGEDEKDEFYYCLYLLSMLSNMESLLKVIDHIVKGLNSFRVKRKVTSNEEFQGEINIEEYIQRNYAEKVTPKEYPSIIKYSSFQLPEYQLALYIIKHCEQTLDTIFSVLGSNDDVTMFKIAHRYSSKLKGYRSLLQRRYGISYGRRENYLSLKKRVSYRYRNRKIVCNDFKTLMKLYEKIICFTGIDFNSNFSLNIFDNYPAFDDRLYEIWLIRRSTELLANKLGVDISTVEYVPLFKARKYNSYTVKLQGIDCRIELLFQNRKSLMPHEDLKWFYWTENGSQKEIGAIPDLVFLKYEQCMEKPSHIVLVDAKNRTWTFDRMEPIKAEIVQQIYIHDNFICLFKDRFCSILLAHNVESLQTRRFYHKDKPGYEINVLSLDLNEGMIDLSLRKYVDDLSEYLEI